MKNLLNPIGTNQLLMKILIKMKLTFSFLLFGLVSVNASVYSQNTRLNIEIKENSIIELFKEIEEKSEFYFFYKNEDIADLDAITVSKKNSKVTEILDEALKGSNLEYKIVDRYIIVRRSGDEFGDMERLALDQKAVSGTVTDNSGGKLPGVTIVIKGTSNGTITDAEGNYTLNNVSQDAILVFSFVGMQTQEIVIGNRNRVDITMIEETIGLEEVVAIGYGNLQRNKISTSISSLEPQKVKVQVTSSIDKALEGQIAGLTVKQNSGAPGGGSELQIRGTGSIGNNNQPLVVIDGIPMQNIYGMERSPLTLLNQADIASIDVLKGVSAAAIYGSRGSNGVILITTESGKLGKTEFSFSAKVGVDRVLGIEKLDLMNAQEFAQWRKENYYEEAAFYGYEITDEDIPEVYRNPELLGKGTDWFDVLTQVAPKQEYNLNVSHGTERFKGFFSMGYLNNQGVVKETSFERISMRANMIYEPNNIIALGMNLNPTIRTWTNQVGGARTTNWGIGSMSTPIDGPYREDGEWERDNDAYYDGKWDLDIWSPGTFSTYNALYALKNQVDVIRDYNLRFQPYISLKPVKGLTFKSQYNLELSDNTREYFRPSTISSWSSPPPLAATGYYNTNRSYGWQFENTVMYDNVLGEHNVTILAGYTMEHYNGYSSRINGSQFSSDDIKTLNASTVQTGNTYETNWSLISYLFRANYDYQSKYLFTGTIRRDGSSRFGSDKRWGYFPSVSVGWNITKEDFFPEAHWITNLKLRASYGYSGNNDIGNYTWIPTLTANNYTFGGKIANGQRVAAMENTMLSWEMSKEFDAGLDLVLFGGRINFVFDYYSKITENMLWPVDVPISSGFSSVQDNVGKIRNRGVEFSLSTINITKKDFTWNSDFNISFNKNLVLDMGEVGRLFGGFKNSAITMEGQPMAMFYGWKHIGILNSWEEVEEYATMGNQPPGTNRFMDLNDDKVINERDKLIIGNPWPDFRGGMNNSFKYGHWDLNISLSFAHDFDIYAQLEQDVRNLDGVFNVLKEVKDRWRSAEQPGNGIIPASFHNTEIDRSPISSRIHNVSFLKVQNITAGYTFNSVSFIKMMRLYGSVQNPFIFTNYKYGNPDSNLHGNNALARNYHAYDYPLSSSFVFGVDLKF
jgi:TonB-linked SusC/RagA family outer membrane protein